MAEVDPVILELRADLSRYQAQLRATTTTVDKAFGQQEKRAQRLEAQMRRSSDGIASSFQGLAGVLAGAFTGRELVGLIDGYTRLQNELRVAGLEGEALAAVQGRLFEVANRNGVAVNSLADLYGKSAQAGKELGASQEQLLALTENTALALRISGTDATTAAGAILGLSQALSSGTVRAEEFNQINEGGLRPLLQAAAASERFGGSVAKLRAAVLDGKLSSQEFFQTILAGSQQLAGQAAKATLTLSGAFQTLNNKLLEYVGSNASATGATGLIAGAIQSLAENLDDLIEALGVIATVFAGRFVAGALAGGRALQVISAYAAIATTSLAGTALAARGAGAALLTALGGPVGAAVTALVLGLGYLATRAGEAGVATGAYAVAQRQAADATGRAAAVAQQLATAHGKVRVEALAAARAEAENTKQKLAGARASVILAQAELKKAQAFQSAQNTASIGGGVAGTASFIQGTGDKKAAQARTNLDAANANVRQFEGAFKAITEAISAAAAPAVKAIGAPGSAKPTGSNSGPTGPTGPTAAEIERRFADELTGYTQQTLAARQQTARTADERAELELRSLEHARRRTLASIAADEDYSKAQKEELAFQVEQLALREREVIELRRRAEEERGAQDLADERYQAERDQLGLQYDLADTQEQRRAIAFRILAAEDAYLKSKLEAVLASQTATEAEKERARIALAAVQASAVLRAEVVRRAEQGPLGRYADDAKDANQRVEEAAARRIRDLNDTIADAMTNALGIEDPFLRDLIGIFLDKNVFGPLAESLSKSGGAGGVIGAIVSGLGSLFGGGKASGGRVNAGTLYRVNEGGSPGRVEGFRPDVGGNIIPLGRMNAARPASAGGGTIRVVVEEAPGFASRVQVLSSEAAVEVTRIAAPTLIDAAANETMRRANRPGL